MSSLDELLHRARTATPGDRIEWRDPIARYGASAIPQLVAWLDDPRLGPFAVRVLERIATDPTNTRTVVDALVGVRPEELADHVARDVADALNRIPGGTSLRGRSHPGSKEHNVEPWPGRTAVTVLERRFHEAMLDIYQRAGEATRRRRPDGTFQRGYWANYFLRAVRSQGGPAYARQLLRAQGTTDGFRRLKEEGRLDITMEALVLRPEFAPLFTESDRKIAEQRLKAAGYNPAEPRKSTAPGGDRPD